MMSGAKKRVPKRRFKEFLNAGDWEQRKLGDIVDFLDGQRKPLKESDRIKGKYPYYGASGIIDYINDYLFDENLVLLSEDGANIIDRNYPICFIATGKYWVNNHAHVLKVKAGVIDKFICESLERLDYTKFNTGTAQPKLNQDICQKIVITIPNEDEQKCISEFLNRINNIITLHQRKLDKLQATKKALLQEMFPEEGQDKPKRRFKGFTDAWEQRKLGDLTQLITKGTTPKVKNIQNGINFIKVENISDDGVISINSYVSEEEHMNYLSRSIISNDDILFSIAGTLGRTAIVKSHLLPANTNQALAIIRLNKSVDVEYINTFLKSNAIKTYIRKNPTVGAQPNLSLGQVSDLEINIPSYSEQKKISNLFSNFDLMITLHQRKLDKLKNLKQAYLNEMFV